mmetsp:Transcript_19404/g.39876  ORF Transcript_19404/g.39876 Transcript_19404/m.39876 type:complete len:98 (-) Transcript_19404:138-431(-)
MCMHIRFLLNPNVCAILLLVNRILKLAVARKLLDNGADLHAADAEGNTGLHMASRVGFGTVVSFLMAQGADQSAANKDGKTAKDLALDSHISGLFGS